MAKKGFSVLILAAGKATRFKSEHSKMLHRLAGRPLGAYALDAAIGAGPERATMVIGHEADEVRKTFSRPEVTFIEQKEQLGTGHALIVASGELERSPSSSLVVLVGDAHCSSPQPCGRWWRRTKRPRRRRPSSRRASRTLTATGAS